MNKNLEFWQFALDNLETKKAFALLLVLESKGSSPGRQGFKLLVNEEGAMHGSIGGGPMEFQLVELAKELLEKKKSGYLIKKQVHREDSGEDGSGMVCSGEQTVVIYPVFKAAQKLYNTFSALKNQNAGLLKLSQDGFNWEPKGSLENRFSFFMESTKKWQFQERHPQYDTINIIGGGHVGLALSRQMSILGFYVKVFDEREGLNTIEKNIYAKEKIIVPYKEVGKYIHAGPDQYAVIMTFGYETDKIALEGVVNLDISYLALMGSKAKVRKLFNALKQEGISRERLEKIYAPAGLDIRSKTPEEIAVSIAAQIIALKPGE